MSNLSINKNDPILIELESFFSALSDKTRLEIVFYLLEKNVGTVQEIANGINKNQSLVSHHLSCLKNCGVVKLEKKGKFSLYEINGDNVKKIIKFAINHVESYSKSILSCDIIKEEKKEEEKIL
ncbi:putative transcriptional regulator [Caldisphaera lagunensis DSM 15908]|uniref:Putative transcriptional regulator n=1 Tax=Caldisphaera lagunensis (strain DSM 15908 / JCM 11604 / ANMR 0165 / IC-154) TaxID=1056495 RepID=L0ABE1_CALLD|nr:metalloregulator ArsR/SmtB family transcription factor [Caldisphaera lagunensis]AFZ70370.1 putative transcriptional regulator [Caldisphaera lagunensis DSM 15908]